MVVGAEVGTRLTDVNGLGVVCRDNITYKVSIKYARSRIVFFFFSCLAIPAYELCNFKAAIVYCIDALILANCDVLVPIYVAYG